MPKESDDLTRKGDKRQTTKKARLRIPVPKRDDVFAVLKRSAARQEQEPEESEQE